jgi:hypothetical protein
MTTTTTPPQNWLIPSVVPLMGLALTAFTAAAVLRRGWYRVLPVLSTYVLTLAVTGIPLMVVYALQAFPSPIQYAACRAYVVGYQAHTIMNCFLSLAVLYELFFSMAGTNKIIRRAAVAGFVIAASITTAGAYVLMNQFPLSPSRLVSAATFLWRVTALTLLGSGIFVFVVKKVRSLYLETNLSRILAALTICNFMSGLSYFILRGRTQTGLVVSQIIWLAFAVLLYAALRNEPSTAAQRC